MTIKRLKQQRTTLIICLVLSMILHLAYGIEGMKQTETLELKNSRQAAQLKDKDYQIEILEIILKNREQDASEPMATEPEYIGEFEITYYCPCTKCCGADAVGITHTGTLAQEGKTVAVDPNVIPLGSTLIIDGQTYIAEDTGSVIKGNKIDIFKDSHVVALEGGRHKADVWIVEESLDE